MGRSESAAPPHHGAARQGATRRTIVPLAVALALVYCALQAVVLSMLNSGLSIDLAEQLLYTQTWSWGYGRSQPPLYTWLMLAAIELFGTNLMVFHTVKFGLFAVAFIATYLTGRRLGLAEPAALAAALGMFLVYEIGWEAQRAYAHTVLLLATASLMLLAFVHLWRTPNWTAYGLFGLTVALAVLSKYNAVYLVAAIVAAACLRAETRALVANRRIFAAILVALLVLAPHALWALDNRDALLALSGKFEVGAGTNPVIDRLYGLSAFVWSLVTSSAVTIVIVLFAPRRDAGPRVIRLAAGKPWSAQFPAAVVVIGLLLVLLTGLIAGATAFLPRWLVLLTAYGPLAAIALLASEPARDDLIVRWHTIAGGAAAIVFGVGLWGNSVVGDFDPILRVQFDYRRALAELEQRFGAFDGIITNDYATIANLRLYRPDLRILHPSMPEPETIGTKRPIYLWTEADTAPPDLRELGARLGVAAPDPRTPAPVVFGPRFGISREQSFSAVAPLPG